MWLEMFFQIEARAARRAIALETMGAGLGPTAGSHRITLRLK